ncbi:MAG: site-2 protease family protein [Clostridia bacterium]|nr:site-2 protease family protein [Clostridia bacterium]
MFLEDKRFLYVILGILIISNLARMTTEGLLAILLTLPAVLIAITFHEYAHAFAATKLGDDTPMLQGRLTLNPMKHIDPVGFALLLFAGFGWGKPVQINPRNFNRKYSIEAGEAIVSVAGPIMNFVLAVVFALIYAALYRFAPTFIITQVGAIVFDMLLYLVMINIGLGVFNLIPLPPLDGSKILIKFLPYNAKQWFRNKETIFYIIFLVLWISGLTGYIISPALNFLYKGMLNGALALFGLF